MNTYRRTRALNLSLVRRLPLAQAIDLTVVTKPVRPDLNAALKASVTSSEDAVAVREAVQTARAELNAMVQLAESLLSQANSLDTVFGSSISIEDYDRHFDELQAMETLASEEFGGEEMDLTTSGGGDGGDGSGD